MSDDEFAQSLLVRLPPPPDGADVCMELHDGTVRITCKLIVSRSVYRLLLLTGTVLISALIALVIEGGHAGSWDGPMPLWLGLSLASVAALVVWPLLLLLLLLGLSRTPTRQILLTAEHADIRARSRRLVVGRDQVTAVAPLLMPRPRWDLCVSGRWPVWQRRYVQKVDLLTPQGRVRVLSIWGQREAEWIAQVMQVWSGRPMQPIHDLTREPIDDPAYVARRPHWVRAGGVGLAVLLVGVVGWLSVAEVVPALNSRTWPVTRGHVVKAQVTGSGDDRTYQIRYAYRVGGQDYHSNSFGYLRVLNEHFFTTRPTGSIVPVYYDSHRPERCVLVRGLSPIGWCCVGLVATILLPGLLTAWGLLRVQPGQTIVPLTAYRVAMPRARPRRTAESVDLLAHLPPRTKRWTRYIGLVLLVTGGTALAVLFVQLIRVTRQASDYDAIKRDAVLCLIDLWVWLGALVLWFVAAKSLDRWLARRS